MAKRNDLSGQKFSKLTAIRENGRDSFKRLMWLCICECGTELTVSANNLRSGNSKSCGCLTRGRRPRIDLSGQRFGFLSVVSPAPIEKKGRIGKWICQCDCGSIAHISSIALRRGKTKSCGCYRRNFMRIKQGKISDARWAAGIKAIFEGCAKCGSTDKLHAHHIYPATLKELKTDPSNGIALCQSCHVNFHRAHGKGNHGPSELVEFLGGGRDLDFLLGLIVGWRVNGGLSNLKRARHYIDLLIEHEESRMCSTRSGTMDSTMGES